MFIDLTMQQFFIFHVIIWTYSKSNTLIERERILFLGLAAGGDFETYGSAAEYVCLPHNPDFNLAEKSTHKDRAYIYGSEYQDNLFGNNFHDKDVPCAVCISNLAKKRFS